MDRQAIGRDDMGGMNEGESALPPREGYEEGGVPCEDAPKKRTRRGRRGRGKKRAAEATSGGQPRTAGATSGGQSRAARAASGGRSRAITEGADPRPAAGHAGHFLSRLDRVERTEVDFALGLYRDPQLVRMILARSGVPEGQPRVAISLDDARKGPFLVVTRAGHFVTCLGRDMSPGQLPVVTRQKLEAALTIAGDQRARSQALHERVADLGGSKRLINRIFERSDWLSREEFVAVSALQPLLSGTFMYLYLKSIKALSESQLAYAFLLRRRRSDKRLEPGLRAYWKMLWSMGHFLTLAAMGDRQTATERFSIANGVPGLEEHSLSVVLMNHGIAPLALRGAWAMGRAGKQLVGRFKGALAAPNAHVAIVDAAMALGAIGLRQSRTRSEIQKVMATTIARAAHLDPLPPDPAREDLYKVWGQGYASEVHALLDAKTDELDARGVREGRKALFDKLEARLEAGKRPFASPNDIPESVARAALFDLDEPFTTSFEAALRCTRRVGAVARASAEDFYFPADLLPHVRRRWQPEHSIAMLERMNRCFKPGPPRRVEKTPGRNDRCVCTSGKKYKRCCGA